MNNMTIAESLPLVTGNCFFFFASIFYSLNPLSPHDALKHQYKSLKTTDGFKRKISIKLVYQYMVIFFNF